MADSLTVLDEIKKALFPLREEELTALETSVLAEGIRDPLVVWPRDGQLILVESDVTQPASLPSVVQGVDAVVQAAQFPGAPVEDPSHGLTYRTSIATAP